MSHLIGSDWHSQVREFGRQFSLIAKKELHVRSTDRTLEPPDQTGAGLDPKRVIFAALFMAGKTPIDNLAAAAGVNAKDVKRLLYELEGELDKSLEIVRDKDFAEIRVKKEYLPAISDLCPKADFNEAELKTLALIAYYQPLKRSDLVKHRGVFGHVHANKFIEQGYISEREGKLITTEKFERYFGVKGLSKEDMRAMAVSG